ncbi:MAG: TlpA family protein disulfide reductase [Chthoniobacteraceae bacterium]|nr:TlpA family protein disulfide reductase [Chthoniobacteraceae bacterium]
MKRPLILFISLLFLAAVHADDPKPATSIHGKLQWRNTETSSGELLEASATDATWKSPLFQDPLLLSWDALRRIDQPLPPATIPEPFSVVLRDGSFLHGDLVSISENAIALHSARHGDCVLKRSEVLSIRRIRGGNLIAAGPAGDVGWDLLANRKNIADKSKGAASPVVSPAIPSLTTGVGGALLIPYWNRAAFLNLALPELVDIEFRLHSSARPDFQISFVGVATQRLRIATWDDELVLAAADQFKLIRKMGEEEREVALRICWDRKARKCALFTSAGEPLTEWEVPEDPASIESGLVLVNKGRDLSLELLRIRIWDGKPPAKVNLKEPRIELADGRVLEGRVVDGTAESINLMAPDTAASFPLGEIEALIFSTDAPKVSGPVTTFSFSDATLLRGTIASFKEGRFALKTAFSEEPLLSQIGGLRQLLLPAAEIPAENVPGATVALEKGPEKKSSGEAGFAKLDKLVVDQATLHGTLAGEGDASPRWWPVGGMRAATPVKGSNSVITRAMPAGVEVQSAPALFYTSSGDVLSGTLRLLDRNGVEFESGMIEVKKLAADSLDAVQFQASAASQPQGFGDPSWRVIKGNETTVRRTNEKLNMEVDTSIGSSSVMQSSEIRFSLAYSNMSTIRLRMFCAGMDASKSTNLILSHWGSRVYYGLELADNQMNSQQQVNVSSSVPVAVRLVINEKQVELFLNDIQIQSYPIDSAKRAGAGLIIEPASIWGNSVNPVELSDFSAATLPGHTWLPDVTAETRIQALTVPRFRKDDLPRHVLLASNGDALRGEVEAATTTHFGFRSGLENLRIPRDRVKAAIWLKKPADESAPAAEKSPLFKHLDDPLDGARAGIEIAVNLQYAISMLQSQVSDLVFKLPEKPDKKQVAFQLGGQTIGSALEQICKLYGLHYRIDEKGVIVLEPGLQAAKNLVQKTYWLKAATFAAAGPVEAILESKGVPFPTGTKAIWQPATLQLAVENTAANQTKLAAVLESDFGGILGSPTHWLLMTNGARLGLTVDKFEADSITGHHPVYGRCTVPMSQVYVIRSSMPEPTASMRVLRDWHLVLAPEPVLPDTGGQSSPTLGKEAKSFKLPLLAGGDFDLAREKGKVIVLDFWATWCGPCIKALPGLIEAMAAFPEDRVKLIGVNQSEPGDQVKRFLETRGWKLTVAMDAGQNVAKQYGVDGIPHTVIIGPDGKVAWVKTGYSADGGTEAADAVKQLLAAPAPPEPAPKEAGKEPAPSPQ